MATISRKKIFITGATGFIGIHLLKRLSDEKYKIVVLVRQKKLIPKLKGVGIKVVVGDITKPKTFKKELNQCYILVHLAAMRTNWGLPEQFIEVNSFSLENFFTYGTQIRHMIITSSVYAMGKLSKLPADESEPLSPFGIYGKSKIRLEQITKKISKKYNIPFTIIRPAIVYGPNDNDLGMIIKMINLISKKRLPIIGNGDNLLHLIFIDDLTQGILKIIKRGGHNQTYILAGPRPITLLELIALIKKSLGVDYQNIFIPKWLLIPIANLVEIFYKLGFKIYPKFFFKEPFILPIKLHILTDNWFYNSRKAKTELKFEPKVDYKEGIQKTVRWFQTR